MVLHAQFGKKKRKKDSNMDVQKIQAWNLSNAAAMLTRNRNKLHGNSRQCWSEILNNFTASTNQSDPSPSRSLMGVKLLQILLVQTAEVLSASVNSLTSLSPVYNRLPAAAQVSHLPCWMRLVSLVKHKGDQTPWAAMSEFRDASFSGCKANPEVTVNTASIYRTKPKCSASA